MNSDEEDEEFVLPRGVSAFCSTSALETENTRDAIQLWWAPRPFNQRSGYTKRAIDVPLVNGWFIRWIRFALRLKQLQQGLPVRLRLMHHL